MLFRSNNIGGTISSQGSVNPTASVVNPSATWFPLVSIASAYSSADSGTKSWKKPVLTTGKLAKAIASEAGFIWKNLQDGLFPELLNSYSNIRNRGHLTELAKALKTVAVDGQLDRYGRQAFNTIYTSSLTGQEVAGHGLEAPKGVKGEKIGRAHV